MRQVDKVHVVIGIKAREINAKGTPENTSWIATTLDITNQQARKVMRDIESRKNCARDFSTTVRMTYSQLGRYIAKRQEDVLINYWIWPKVIKIERPVPKLEHIYDLTEGQLS